MPPFASDSASQGVGSDAGEGSPDNRRACLVYRWSAGERQFMSASCVRLENTGGSCINPLNYKMHLHVFQTMYFLYLAPITAALTSHGASVLYARAPSEKRATKDRAQARIGPGAGPALTPSPRGKRLLTARPRGGSRRQRPHDLDDRGRQRRGRVLHHDGIDC